MGVPGGCVRRREPGINVGMTSSPHSVPFAKFFRSLAEENTRMSLRAGEAIYSLSPSDCFLAALVAMTIKLI
jgi:hypothetical protein